MSAAIAVGALIAALAPLVAMYLTLKHTTAVDHDSAQERRITRLEQDLEDCHRRSAELQEENLQLMRRILK
jgi:hypothetical protein